MLNNELWTVLAWVTKFKEENNISTCEQFQFEDGLSHSISFDFWTYPSYDIEG
jgi:hypothetical protein